MVDANVREGEDLLKKLLGESAYAEEFDDDEEQVDETLHLDENVYGDVMYASLKITSLQTDDWTTHDTYDFNYQAVHGGLIHGASVGLVSVQEEWTRIRCSEPWYILDRFRFACEITPISTHSGQRQIQGWKKRRC